MSQLPLLIWEAHIMDQTVRD